MLFDKSVICPVLIGRERDLQSLDRLLAQSLQSRGQIALISGEAGIGKSRLVREVKSQAPQGTAVLEGHCFQTDSTLPYAPLLDLLRNLLEGHSGKELAGAVEASAPLLARFFPEGKSPLPESIPGPDPEQEKRRLFQELAGTLTGLAGRQPLLVILEDLHWSDATSLEFLLLFARRISSLPVLLLLTYRSDETTPELTHFLAEVDRERLGTEFTLKPLSSPDVEAMLQAILDSPQIPISQEFLEAIFSLSEGNPFFIEEILKSLITEGDIFYTGAGWERKELDQLHIPRTIQDAVQRRTQQLDAPTRQALTLGSVMGRRFDFRLLQELLSVNEADLLAMLKELIGAQLVVEETADQFAFRHALTRQAIYNTLLLRERQALHRSVAEAIERSYAGTLDVHAADLSYHYYTGGAWQKALEYSRRAGDQAQALYAQREAVVYYSRALVSARQLNIAVEPQLFSARGHAYEILGDFSSALDDFEQARKLTQEKQDGRAEWQILIDLGILWTSRDYQRTGAFFRQAQELAQKLNDSKLQAHSLNRIGHWLYVTGQTGQAIECHRQALEFFEGAGDEPGMAETYDILGMSTLHHGDQVGSFAEYQHAIRLCRKLDDKPKLISALIGASHTLNDETDFIPSQSRLENQEMAMEAIELSRQIGWASAESFAEWGTAIGLATWGRFEEALGRARTAFRIGTEIRHPQRTTSGYYALGYVYLLMLQADSAIEYLEAGSALARQHGSAWLVGNTTADLAQAYLLKHDTARARSLLDSVLPQETNHPTRAERRMLSAKGYLLLAENNPAEALQIAEHLLDLKRGPHETQPIPGLLKLQGEALFALKQFKKAERSLERARQGAEQREALPLLWQIHSQLGWLYKEQKNVEKSEREFASARQVLHTLVENIQDEPLRADFIQAAFERLPNERKSSKRQSETEKFGGLTSREREVAQFLSGGKSNREIAERLVLSERTVENHISNILRKLGFDSRAQIAVWAVEKGLGKEKN